MSHEPQQRSGPSRNLTTQEKLAQLEPYIACLISLRRALADFSSPDAFIARPDNNPSQSSEAEPGLTNPAESTESKYPFGAGIFADDRHPSAEWIRRTIDSTFEIVRRDIQAILERLDLPLESIENPDVRTWISPAHLSYPDPTTLDLFRRAREDENPPNSPLGTGGDSAAVTPDTGGGQHQGATGMDTDPVSGASEQTSAEDPQLPLFNLVRGVLSSKSFTDLLQYTRELIPNSPLDPLNETPPLSWSTRREDYSSAPIHASFDIPLLLRDRHEEALKDLLLNLQNQATLHPLGYAELVLTGAPSQELLEWCRGGGPEDSGPIPAVNIMFELPLPSGASVPFVLKANSTGEKLERSLDPSAYDLQDTDIVLKLRQAIRGAALTGNLSFLTDIQFEDYSDNVRKLITETPPREVSFSGLRQLYAEQRASIWNQLKSLATVSEGAAGTQEPLEFRTREAFESHLVEMINQITTHPRNFRPDVYFLNQSDIPAFLERYSNELFELHQHEIQDRKRRLSPQVQQVLEQELYAGPRAGYPLPLIVQLLDKIYDYKQSEKASKQAAETDPLTTPTKTTKIANRSYVDIGIKLEDLTRDLRSNPPQRHVELSYFDTTTGKERHIATEQEIRKFVKTIRSLLIRGTWDKATPRQKDLLKTIIVFRLSEEIEWLNLDLSLKVSPKNTPIDIFEDIAAQVKRLRKFADPEPAKADILNKLAQLMTEVELLKFSFAYQPSNLLWARNAKKLDDLQASAEIAAIKPPNLFQNFRIVDGCLAKYIYAIGTSGTKKIARESLSRDGKIRLRPTHSQIAEGKTVWAAGELLVGTHDETFTSVHAWLQWLRENPWLEGATDYRVLEVNNLSGHYLHTHESLKYAGQKLLPTLQASGFDTSRTRLVNRLLTGVEFSLVSLHGLE